MSFGENLKNVRKQRGVTQEELAEILGVSRQAISKWESDSGYPETEKLLVISKTLNISIDYLLNDVTVMKEKEKTEEKKLEEKLLPFAQILPKETLELFLQSYENEIKIKEFRLRILSKAAEILLFSFLEFWV